jgi:hypothetical protein
LDAVNTSTVQSNLTPLSNRQYTILSVHGDSPIRDFVQGQGFSYSVGKGYYQLTKTETIQPQKQIMIREKRTGKVYSGASARDLLGLPHGMSVRVKPEANPEYDVFVQSTSVNRKVLDGTDLIVLT